MLQFERIDGPYGIPVYFQPLPETIGPIGLRWLVFVGSADDPSVGLPGLYHWFEHVPFRGTVRYPGGYADTIGRFRRYGGYLNAHTSKTRTAYYGFVPRAHWWEALDVLTDLIAQPLLTEDGINSEREIIRDEQNRARSKPDKYFWQTKGEHLFSGHPLAHPVLGTDDTLTRMGTGLLRQAHGCGYSRSRCVLLVSGALDRTELFDAVAEQAARIPELVVAERRLPACYAPLPPWPAGRTFTVDTPFPSSLVALFFPVPARPPNMFHRAWAFLKALFETGGLNSPLLRILREQRNLVYSAWVTTSWDPDGGIWGFRAETRPEHIDAVLRGFWDVLCDAHVHSQDWEDYVRDAIRSLARMRVAHPDDSTKDGEDRLVEYGRPMSDVELEAELLSVTREEVLSLLDTLTPERACILIYRGLDKT